MQRLVPALMISAFGFSAFAQQRPQYTQYLFNYLLINPAVSGIENYTDVKLGHRSQWTGLEGAPTTTYLSINAPLGGQFLRGDAAASPGAGLNPLSRSYVQDYRAAAPHHGIGLLLFSDQAGLIGQTTVDATYAYHLGISPSLNLSVGVAAGASHLGLNTNNVVIENPNDVAVDNAFLNKWRPDLSLGVWAYSPVYYLGFSAQQLLPAGSFAAARDAADLNRSVPHYFATGGVKLFLSEELTLIPSLLVKFIRPLPVSYDLNLKLAFSDRFWVGGSYRKNDSFAGLAGVNVSSFLNIGYAYDATVSTLHAVNSGSHEIVIGILLNNRYKVICPERSF